MRAIDLPLSKSAVALGDYAVGLADVCRRPGQTARRACA